MGLKLEVGKKYHSRHGEVVKIVRRSTNRVYPFKGDDSCLYGEDGRFDDTCASKFDLIEEVVEAAPSPAASSALARQEGGGHYKDMAIQPMQYSMANGLDACQHTAIKYVTRFRQKGGVDDLRKAIHTLEMLIEFEEQGISAPVLVRK